MKTAARLKPDSRHMKASRAHAPRGAAYIENGLGSVIMEDRVAADHIIHISKHTGKDELTFK